ncbi:MAG: hypothetical protein N3A57_00230, partial [Negativicutes bacterium]|nr:hypothetical protein [Negativicutes bacterium]
IIKVPNAFILVPGVMGFSAIVLMINNEILAGIDKLLSAIGVAISIIAGFIVADIICPARRLGD